MISRNGSLSRRDFVVAALEMAGVVAGTTSLGGTAQLLAMDEKRRSSAPGRPKIGCVSWCFHPLKSGVDPSEAIDMVGSIGFEGTELMLMARKDIKDFWTDDKIDQLRRKLEQNKLEISQFVIFQHVVDRLYSLDPKRRERNLDYFEAGCKIGKKLGAPIINIVAQWPRQIKGPGGFLPRYYDLRNAKPGEKFHIEIAPDFDWDRIWNQYLETTKACLERVKAHGMKLTIEHHTHCVVNDSSSFLRLWDAVKDPDLGYNLDTGWTMIQREYPPLVIHQVKDHLMNLHVRDIDGSMRSFVHVGEGVMDFKAIARALKITGFRGFLSIEQDKYPGNMKATCSRYLRMMKEYLG